MMMEGSVKISLLYIHKVNKAGSYKVSSHFHDFWQLEIVNDSCIDAVIGGKNFTLNSRDMLLIKPGIEHGFIYKHPDISWTSLKFNVEGPGTEADDYDAYTIIRHSSFTGRLISSLEAIVHNTALEDYEKAAIEGHIEAILRYLKSSGFTHPGSGRNTTIAEDIIGYIRSRNGKAITINEIAKKLLYSRSHISKMFKKQTGQSLKSYIDQIRLEKAKEMLLYSDFSISDIAFDLGFKDIYSFSKFFKKHTALSPKLYRKNNQVYF